MVSDKGKLSEVFRTMTTKGFTIPHFSNLWAANTYHIAARRVAPLRALISAA